MIAKTILNNGDRAVTTKPKSLDGKGSQDGTLDAQTNALPPRLLDYQAASSYLSLSYWSVRTLVVNGDIPHVKFGKRVLLDRLALDEWVEKNHEWGV
jgi:excisionase family DNA binding protein